ncbi:MAG: 4Fe-4S dicluster domain-containing protein [Bacteroidia bacterium]
MISSIIFILVFGLAIYFFSKNIQKVVRNIKLGKPLDRSDNPSERLKVMAMVALGQSKMVVRPVAGIMHIIVYLGFILINIEVLEIIIDGIFGTHRFFAAPLGSIYTLAINFFELLAVGVIIACVVFLVRRNILKIDRFTKPELKGWPFKDANIILLVEIILMGALLKLNAVEANIEGALEKPFIVSQFIAPFFASYSQETLHIFERIFWWFHILGILAFLNYLPFSKHFHILLAFPNTYFSNLKPKGKFTNMESVTNEVKIMLDPSYTPTTNTPPGRFGAKDVTDLTWKQLLDAYTCTECGRCTSECPANQTGKLLSPRKIMMDTRDRLEEVGRNIDINKEFKDDGKSLLGNYITEEEILACTTCNACVQACPVNIDPLSIIIDLRRYLIMEESKAPAEWAGMLTNIENNGAPWQFSPSDRFNWANEN